MELLNHLAALADEPSTSELLGSVLCGAETLAVRPGIGDSAAGISAS